MACASIRPSLGSRSSYADFSHLSPTALTATFTLLIPYTTLPLLLHQNSSGNTPLHWAGLNGHLPLVKAIVERVEELEKIDVEGARGIRVKQREEERRRREVGRRRRREEEEREKGETKEGETEGEAKKTTNGEKKDDDDDEDPPELSLWDLRNNFGRGPTSESQMNEREEVVQWLLARMAAGGGSSSATAAEKKDEAGAGDKETAELERRTEQASLEEKEKA